MKIAHIWILALACFVVGALVGYTYPHQCPAAVSVNPNTP